MNAPTQARSLRERVYQTRMLGYAFEDVAQMMGVTTEEAIDHFTEAVARRSIARERVACERVNVAARNNLSPTRKSRQRR